MSWQVLLGVVTWWADEGLRDVGRQRFQAARGRRLTGDRSQVDFVDFHQAAFVAQRSPWRLAQVTLTDQPSSAPAVAAWADTATAVLTDEPVAQHVVGPNESWGDLGCRRMLDPKPLTAIVTPPWEASFVIDGSRLENDREFVVPEPHWGPITTKPYTTASSTC